MMPLVMYLGTANVSQFVISNTCSLLEDTPLKILREWDGRLHPWKKLGGAGER